MSVVSGTSVRGDIKYLSGYLESYSKNTTNFSGSWEGASYDSFSKAAGDFITDCEKISKGMEAFAKACDKYNNDYLAEKRKKEDREAKKRELESKNIDGVYQEDIRRYNDEIDVCETKMTNYKGEIEKYLSEAASYKIDTGSSVSLSSVGANFSGAMGLSNQLGGDSGVLPDARIGEDRRPDPKTNKFFQNEANGGINGYPLNGSGTPGVDGNCTYYAYSRFSELLGHEAQGIADGDACSWYKGTTGYKKGKTPKLGSIAVWQYGNSNSRGHVAVVEAIKDNGDIVVSEGGWSSNKWYGNSTYNKANGYAMSGGHLLGFIYPEEA